MMSVPGVVVVATFSRPDQISHGRSLSYASYIDYKNREEAVKKPLLEEPEVGLEQVYEGYMDYMGNPDKTLEVDDERVSGLFTASADTLMEEDIQALKDQYNTAQKNGSLMWEALISFDNDWLSAMGVYHKQAQRLDENRMRNVTRKAVAKLLEKEELNGAVWSAAFHYNTDNIHAHISIVEPHPTRKKKVYKQYETTTVDGKHQYKLRKNEETGKMERIPILDESGNICKREEYVGRFKESNLKAAKSAVVEELVQDKELNIEINQLIRQRLVQSLKDNTLYQDEDFRERFLQIYEKLPENRGVCNYKNSAMAHLRPRIDALADLYIEKYHKDDFEVLQTKLRLQEAKYQAAYGESDDTYLQNKLSDLYSRMGNAVLRQLKEYDKSVKRAEETILTPKPAPEALEPEQEGTWENEEQEKALEPGLQEELLGDDAATERLFEPKGLKKYYLNWKDGYSKARDQIYVDRNYTGAIETLRRLSQNGNVLAISEMGNIYHFGRGVEPDEEVAQSFYTEALEGFMACYESDPRYCAYRIGKQYLYGQGTEKDVQRAARYLQEAADKKHSYAMYLLGGLYLQGNGVERDVDAALQYYMDAAELDNPYAQYKLGQIYEQGELADKDTEKAYSYYAAALSAFLNQKGKDDNMLYRIGTMYLNGRGTAVDYRSAATFLHDAAELNHQQAIYQLGKLYLMDANPEKDVEKGIKFLKEAAEWGNMYAMYHLGKLAKQNGDINSARSWYAKSAAMGNEYAAEALYRLEKPQQRYRILPRQTGNYQLREALAWLRRSLDDTVENWLNQSDYEELQKEIAGERGFEME